MKEKSNILSFLILLLIFAIYKNWFSADVIIGGDWPHFYTEVVQQFTFFPPTWSYVNGNGFGGNIITYALDSYLYASAFLFTRMLHIPWEITAKVFWYGLFLLAAIIGSLRLTATVFPSLSMPYRMFGVLIYLVNTYILMIVSGGQMGIALSYAFLPFFFASYISFVTSFQQKLTSENIKKSIFYTLTFNIVVLFDIRVAFIGLLGVLIYTLLYFLFIKGGFSPRKLLNKEVFIYFVFIPGVITFLLQAFWLIPLLFLKHIDDAQIGIASDAATSLRFFSFANFSDAFSLLHPNWPENIFGKTYFLRPEFLFNPLLLFAGLLLAMSGKKKQIALALPFFVTLIISTFLAKGAQGPFGDFYIWLFTTIPGFFMFRDPTKWYVLIALSYAVLIPYALYIIFSTLKSNPTVKKYYPLSMYTLSLVLAVIFIYQMRAVFTGELLGTFTKREVPKEYSEFISQSLQDKEFYRTMWVPQRQRFVLPIRSHPAVEATSFFQAKDSKDFLVKLASKGAELKLRNAGIKYLIIPYDTYGELFTNDRKYSQKERDKFEESLDSLSWLKKVSDGKLTVYQTKQFNDLFTLSTPGELTYFPTDGHYTVGIAITSPSDIIFSQNYSPYWYAKNKSHTIAAQKTNNGYMKFHIDKPGMYAYEIKYEGEKYYLYGRYISIATVVILSLGLLVIKLKKS